MSKQKASEIWRATAGEGLLRMGSSLQGALMSDDKLRAIFDHIDLDKGGTIDREELQVALQGAGKALTQAQIDALMNAADEDGNGEIDFPEFRDILKGVKAMSAATIIQRKAVQRQDARRKAPVKKSTAAITNAIKLDRRMLDKALGEALLAKKSNPKEVSTAASLAPRSRSAREICRPLSWLA